jgi:hypothetical protein
MGSNRRELVFDLMLLDQWLLLHRLQHRNKSDWRSRVGWIEEKKQGRIVVSEHQATLSFLGPDNNSD